MAERKKSKGRSHIDTPQKVYQIPRFIEAEDVLQITNRGWYIAGRRLTDEEVSAIKTEAKDFQKTYLWQLMRRDIHYVAYLQSTNKRASEMDAIYGGAMYKCLEILESFIKQCKSL